MINGLFLTMFCSLVFLSISFSLFLHRLDDLRSMPYLSYCSHMFLAFNIHSQKLHFTEDFLHFRNFIIFQCPKLLIYFNAMILYYLHQIDLFQFFCEPFRSYTPHYNTFFNLECHLNVTTNFS